MIILGAVAGLVLGGGVGAFVIAPKLGGGAAHAAEAPAEGDHGGGGGEHGAPAATAVHHIENLVINPANTNGARFLLVTTTIVAKDEAAAAELKDRDAEIRDRIVTLLGSRTIEQLSDPATRDVLKGDLAAAIGALFKEGTVKRILLPQFVIQ
jgi:flagellar FliL protein